MKLKGINPIERHVEKLVLALVALVFLGVISMQFLAQPNLVNVGSREVPPQDVYKELENQANRLNSQLLDNDPELPEVAEIDLVERYDRVLGSTEGAITSLSAPLGQGVDIAVAAGVAQIESVGGGVDDVSPLVVPSTSQPVALSQWATMDPYAVEALPALQEFVPSQQPMDFASVSIEASFSGTDLAAALSAEEGAGIPRRFWQSTGIAVLGFEVERQELQADGSWSSAAMVRSVPGSALPTRSLASNAGLPELTELVSKALGAEADISRPSMPPTISGAEWLPPSERFEIDDSELTEADRVRRTLARRESELARLEAQGGRTDSRDDRTGPGKTGTSTRPDPRNNNSDRIRERIRELQAEIRELREQLRELGEDEPVRGGVTDTRALGLALLEQDAVQLWAHDLDVSPGATYRYRTRVVINNPLFRKGSQLAEDDAALQRLALEPFAKGGWSAWSDPAVVGAEQYYFVNKAGETGGLSGGTLGATIEVYRVFYGHYRRSTLSLAPGEAISTDIRLPNGLLEYDPGTIGANEAGQAFAAMLADSDAALPAGVGERSGRLTIDLGAYLLDVAANPVPTTDNFGNTRVDYEVVIRESDGSVVVRSALKDQSGPEYTLVSESASSGSRSEGRAPGAPAESPSAALFPPADAQP